MTTTQQVASVETPSTDPASDAGSQPSRRSLRQLLDMLTPRRISAVYLLGIFIVLFGLLEPDTFLTEVTFSLILRSGVVTCILALAFLVPLAAGVYDLSIGAVMSLAARPGHLPLAAHRPAHAPHSAGSPSASQPSVARSPGSSSCKLHVNSFIATLGVSQVLAGAVILLSDNTQMIGDLPDYWSNFGTSDRPRGAEGRVHPAVDRSRALVRPRVHPRRSLSCSPPAATPRRPASPAYRPTACSGACSWPAARSPGSPAWSSPCRAGSTRRASDRATSSPRSPRSSSARRSSRSARTSGAR